MMRLKECHRLAYRTHAVIAVELVVEVRVQAHGAVRHSVAVVVRAAGVESPCPAHPGSPERVP